MTTALTQRVCREKGHRFKGKAYCRRNKVSIFSTVGILSTAYDRTHPLTVRVFEKSLRGKFPATRLDRVIGRFFALAMSMFTQHSHCSHCGARLGSESWPKRCRDCGQATYLNPLPVVVVLVPIGSALVVVRRNIEPSKGTLTLPGGYLDVGETWQEGACRELLEETGMAVDPNAVRLYDVMNGLDQTLVIFGLARPQPQSLLRPFHSKETQEVTLIDGPTELGFPNHTAVVARYFAEKRRKARQ